MKFPILKKEITVNLLELLMLAGIVIYSVWSIGWAISIWKINGGQSCFAPSDFNTFYQAANGNFLYTWVYKNYTLILFKPLTWFNPTTAYLFLMGLSVNSYIILTHYLFKVKHGWIAMLFTLPAYHDIIQVGNIDIILAMAYISPIAALLGILLKPHHIIFSLINSVKIYIQRKYDIRDAYEKNVNDLYTDNLLSNYEKG